MGVMTDLDRLGQRHRELLADLTEVREQLADAIRTERLAGATLVDLMQRSGYSAIETIRQILDPDWRAKINKRRRVAA